MRVANDTLSGLDGTIGIETKTSNPFDISHMPIVSVTATVGLVTGSLSGTYKLQFTNDPDSVPASNQVWIDIPSSSTAFTASGSVGFNYESLGYRAIRATVTISAGSATLSVRVNAKGA
jgi:hypothetical protein